MESTKQLKDEHRAVLLSSAILEKICQKLELKEKVESQHQAEFLEFIKIFIDKCHHGKEEDLLFPALERAGVPKEGGPIGMLLLEHDEGRVLVKKMGENISNPPQFVESARAYIELLGQHIEKENNVLYPMADRRISQADDAKLLKEFDKLELERIGPGKHEEFHQMLEKLARIYLK